MQEEDCVQDITILERDEPGIQFGQRKQTQSTREKVSAFKNRVFSLLMLFVEKSKNTSILLPFLNQELFVQLPDRARELITVLLNRGCLSAEELLKIAQFYKNFLLYKTKKDVRKFSDDFIKILKKIHGQNEEAVSQIVQQMLEVFITKRKCKLNFSFFPFLLKKIPSLRQNVTALATALQLNTQIRPAQQRVIQKLLKSLVKKHNVKEEHQE